MHAKQRLRDKYGPWAVVTGASSGIGLELARQLAGAGINLVLNARNAVRLQQEAHDLREKGIEVRVVVADLSEPAGVEQVIREVRGLDVGLLINNAGFGTSGLFPDASLHEEISMLRVNCEAVLSLTHYFFQRFRDQRRGGIVFLSSVVAFQGVPYAAHYAATKAYVQSFAEALSIELKPFGVDVLTAVPGPVESGFGNRANMRMGSGLKPEQVGVPILNALGRQKQVVPGALSKVLVYALKTVPRFVKTRIMQQVMGGFTKHQRD